MATQEDRDPAFKAAVRKRDKLTCQKCGQRQSELHAHHIIPRDAGGSDDPDNGILLCYRCHREWDSVEKVIPFPIWLTLPPAVMVLRMLMTPESWPADLTALDFRAALFQAADATRATWATGSSLRLVDPGISVWLAEHEDANDRLETRRKWLLKPEETTQP